MSGHHKFSELAKGFAPERKRRIEAKTAKALAELRNQDDSHSVEETGKKTRT